MTLGIQTAEQAGESSNADSKQYGTIIALVLDITATSDIYGGVLDLSELDDIHRANITDSIAWGTLKAHIPRYDAVNVNRTHIGMLGIMNLMMLGAKCVIATDVANVDSRKLTQHVINNYSALSDYRTNIMLRAPIRRHVNAGDRVCWWNLRGPRIWYWFSDIRMELADPTVWRNDACRDCGDTPTMNGTCDSCLGRLCKACTKAIYDPAGTEVLWSECTHGKSTPVTVHHGDNSKCWRCDTVICLVRYMGWRRCAVCSAGYCDGCGSTAGHGTCGRIVCRV